MNLRLLRSHSLGKLAGYAPVDGLRRSVVQVGIEVFPVLRFPDPELFKARNPNTIYPVNPSSTNTINPKPKVEMGS